MSQRIEPVISDRITSAAWPLVGYGYQPGAGCGSATLAEAYLVELTQLCLLGPALAFR
jgi:hypothetical protein